MQTAKELFGKAKEAGKVQKPFLQLGVKLEGGGVKPTGPHTIKIVSDKMGKGKDPVTQEERDELQMIVEEAGEQKLWNIPVKDKQGNLHYLIPKIAELVEGDTVVVEMKRNGLKNYVDFRKVDEIPTVNLDESGETTSGDLGEGASFEDLPTKELPF